MTKSRSQSGQSIILDLVRVDFNAYILVVGVAGGGDSSEHNIVKKAICHMKNCDELLSFKSVTG